MTVYYPAQALIPQFVNPDNGELAIGFTLESYLANSDIPTPLYIDKNGSPAGVSIPINSGGFPEVNGSVENLWLDASLDYKLVLKDENGQAKWTINDLSPRGSVGGVFAGIEFDQSVVNDAIESFSGELLQESIDRANAISEEAQARIDAINAAISAAEDGDAVLTQTVESLQIEAENQGNSIASIQEDISSVFVHISENDESIETLTLNQQQSESTIENQGQMITSLIDYSAATRSSIDDVYGDGSQTNLETFSQESLSYQARIEQAESTLSSAVLDITSVTSRVNDVESFSDTAADRLNLLESQYSDVDSSLSAVVSESASTKSRMDDLNGDGLSVETLASNVESVTSTANSALSTAQSASTSASSAQSEIDTLTGSVASLAQSVQEVTATAENAENTANSVSSSVTQNTQAIATINNGVAAQWEVKASVNDISGTVGLYNDNGVTKFAIDANSFQIWDSSTGDTEAAFDFSNGTLTIRVPTEIPNLSIVTEKIAPSAVTEIEVYDSGSAIISPSVVVGSNTAETDIISDSEDLVLDISDVPSDSYIEIIITFDQSILFYGDIDDAGAQASAFAELNIEMKVDDGSYVDYYTETFASLRKNASTAIGYALDSPSFVYRRLVIPKNAFNGDSLQLYSYVRVGSADSDLYIGEFTINNLTATMRAFKK